MSTQRREKPLSWRYFIRKGRRHRIGRVRNREVSLQLLTRHGYSVGSISGPLVLDPLFFSFRIYPFYDEFSYPGGRARVEGAPGETETLPPEDLLSVSWVLPERGKSRIWGYRVAEELAEKLSVCTGIEWGDVALTREIELFRESLAIRHVEGEKESVTRGRRTGNLRRLWSYPPEARMLWMDQGGGWTDSWPFPRFAKGYPFSEEIRRARQVLPVLKSRRSSFRSHPLFLMGEMLSLYGETTGL